LEPPLPLPDAPWFVSRVTAFLMNMQNWHPREENLNVKNQPARHPRSALWHQQQDLFYGGRFIA